MTASNAIEERILDAANREDRDAFDKLCAHHGRDYCQSVVRTKGARTRPGGPIRVAGGSSALLDRPRAATGAGGKRGARLRLPESAWTDVEIILTEDAIRDLTRTTQWGTGGGALEAADWLMGVATHNTVLVTGASPATKKQSEKEVTLDGQPQADALRLRWSGDDIALIGDHHYQPGTSRPSNVDFDGWERGFRTINTGDFQPIYVGLIATGRPASPTFHGWATRMVDGKLVTKPAPVRGL